MERSPLQGCSILVVEDEPLIAMDIELAFEGSGARLHLASTVTDGLALAHRHEVGLGVLDHGLADGDSHELYECFRARQVPFIIYSGYKVSEEECCGGVVVSKPIPETALRALAEKMMAK